MSKATVDAFETFVSSDEGRGTPLWMLQLMAEVQRTLGRVSQATYVCMRAVLEKAELEATQTSAGYDARMSTAYGPNPDERLSSPDELRG